MCLYIRYVTKISIIIRSGCCMKANKQISDCYYFFRYVSVFGVTIAMFRKTFSDYNGYSHLL